MSDLESWKRQRTTLKGRATRFKTFLESYVDSDSNRLMLEAKLEKHNELWHEYHVIQTKIDELLPEAEVAEREKFEDAFFMVQAAARSKLTRTTDGTMSAQVNLQAANTNQSIVSANQTPVRLPVISLPTFDED